MEFLTVQSGSQRLLHSRRLQTKSTPSIFAIFSKLFKRFSETPLIRRKSAIGHAKSFQTKQDPTEYTQRCGRACGGARFRYAKAMSVCIRTLNNKHWRPRIFYPRVQQCLLLSSPPTKRSSHNSLEINRLTLCISRLATFRARYVESHPSMPVSC